MKIIKFIVGLYALHFVLVSNALPQTNELSVKHSHQSAYHGQTIWDITKVTEESLDIGLWALIIAKEFDPSVDVNKNLKLLDEKVVEIKRMLAGRTKDIEKFLATKMFIYEAGIWNDHKPFAYDLDDPLGEQLENQLLSTYLQTRLGNCVSMPTLFLALMERVEPDIPFVGVAAPLHLFCRFRDRQTADVWNVEATNNGSPARNQWYVEQMNIPQTAVDSGLYLSDLSKKEFLAELIGVLIRKERKQANYKKALEYTELALQLNPNSASALVQKGALLSWIGYDIQEKIKSENRQPTKEESQTLMSYSKASEEYIRQAQVLGWQPETPEQQAKYLQMVKEAKTKQ